MAETDCFHGRNELFPWEKLVVPMCYSCGNSLFWLGLKRAFLFQYAMKYEGCINIMKAAFIVYFHEYQKVNIDYEG